MSWQRTKQSRVAHFLTRYLGTTRTLAPSFLFFSLHSSSRPCRPNNKHYQSWPECQAHGPDRRPITVPTSKVRDRCCCRSQVLHLTQSKTNIAAEAEFFIFCSQRQECCFRSRVFTLCSHEKITLPKPSASYCAAIDSADLDCFFSAIDRSEPSRQP